ncbi:MAG: thioredoxin family protein [Acidimicrobiales bacterium]
MIVNAWAPWCGSCRSLAPIVDDIATATPDVTVIGVRVDAEPALVDRFGVRSLPTLIALRDGIEVARLHGLQTSGAVRDLFDVAAGAATNVTPSAPASLVGSRAAAGTTLVSGGVLLDSIALIILGAILLVWAMTGRVHR